MPAPVINGVTVNGDQKPVVFTDTDSEGNPYYYNKWDAMGNIIVSGSEPGRCFAFTLRASASSAVNPFSGYADNYPTVSERKAA